MSVWWKGHEFDQRSADMLAEVELLTGYDLDVWQGSYSGGVGASAGTHDGCGAVDLSIRGLDPDVLVREMRRVGWAAWERTTAQGFDDPHVHGIAVQPGGKHDRGCLSSGAHDQVVDYFEGRNGLASGGQDDGPREHVGVTWEQYLEDGGDDDEEDDMAAIPWAVQALDAWWITDLATYKTWVGDYKVISDGLDLGAYRLFNAGADVSAPWDAFIRGLPAAA